MGPRRGRAAGRALAAGNLERKVVRQVGKASFVGPAERTIAQQQLGEFHGSGAPADTFRPGEDVRVRPALARPGPLQVCQGRVLSHDV